MIITRPHPFSGKTNKMELDVTKAQMAAWLRGQPINQAMPHLTPDEREFLISGLLPGEFDDLMKPKED